MPVEREALREYVKARLKVFYEEELDVPLVLFNEVLDRITYVFYDNVRVLVKIIRFFFIHKRHLAH